MPQLDANHVQDAREESLDGQREVGLEDLVQAWLVQQRINMAKLLLSETNQTIGEIAQQLGYSDLFYFSKQFKKVSGQSPRHYRLS